MTLDILTCVILMAGAWWLTYFGWVLAQRDRPGFLMLGGALLSMFGDGEVLSTGVGNIRNGANMMSSTDGTVILVLFAVFAITQFGLIWFARQPG